MAKRRSKPDGAQRDVMQLLDLDMDHPVTRGVEKPSEQDEEKLAPLRSALGSLPHLARLRLSGMLPFGCALVELPPLQVHRYCSYIASAEVGLMKLLGSGPSTDEVTNELVKQAVGFEGQPRAGVVTGGFLRSTAAASGNAGALSSADQAGAPWSSCRIIRRP